MHQPIWSSRLCGTASPPSSFSEGKSVTDRRREEGALCGLLLLQIPNKLASCRKYITATSDAQNRTQSLRSGWDPQSAVTGVVSWVAILSYKFARLSKKYLQSLVTLFLELNQLAYTDLLMDFKVGPALSNRCGCAVDRTYFRIV